jgi:hypothetical protein
MHCGGGKFFRVAKRSKIFLPKSVGTIVTLKNIRKQDSLSLTMYGCRGEGVAGGGKQEAGMRDRDRGQGGHRG